MNPRDLYPMTPRYVTACNACRSTACHKCEQGRKIERAVQPYNEALLTVILNPSPEQIEPLFV